MERVSRSQAGVLITSVCAGTLPNRSCLYIYIYIYMYIYILHRTNIVKYLRFVMLYTDPVEIAIKRIDETSPFLLLLDLRSRECISRNLHVSTRQKSNFRREF